MKADISRQFVLGTVQLGLSYGIANQLGKPTHEEAQEVIKCAWNAGIRCFDTAQTYGESEEVLGLSWGACHANEPRVITKLAAGIDIDSAQTVLESVRRSLKRLKIERLWGLMMHDEDSVVRWREGRDRGLVALRKAGLVEHLGVSVYSVERAVEALEHPDIDIIQVAANVFDRRMYRSGVFKMAQDKGKTVFIRSLFLQGLVCMQPDKVSAVKHAKAALDALLKFCGDIRVPVRQFAFDHVHWMNPHGRYVIGAETAAQVSSNAALFLSEPLQASVHEQWNKLWSADEIELIDPRLWPSLVKK